MEQNGRMSVLLWHPLLIHVSAFFLFLHNKTEREMKGRQEENLQNEGDKNAVFPTDKKLHVFYASFVADNFFWSTEGKAIL